VWPNPAAYAATPTATPTAKPTNAVAAIAGRPPVDRFIPDVDVYPQHFSVVQDADGIVYLGSTDGILEYDGESWRLIRLPNGEISRSLALGADRMVYVGGYNIFGYLKRDASGANQFVDLSTRFKESLKGREFADVWETLVTPEGVYFRALNDVFFWNPANDATAHWQHAGRYGLIFRLGDKTLLQFRGEGLRVRVANDGKPEDWKPLGYTAALKDLVPIWVALPDGAMLGSANDGGWWRLDHSSLTRIELPAALKPSNLFSRGLALADKSIALGTTDGRMFIATPGFTRVRQFKIDNGYVSGLATARDGGMVVSSDAGVSRVAWPAEWAVLDAEDGLGGSINGIAQWKSDQYLLTSAGVLRATATTSGMKFASTGWRIDTAYDLFGLDDRRALVAGGHHVYMVENNTPRQLQGEATYPRMFVKSKFHPQKIFMGTEHGMRVLTDTGRDITVSANAPRDPAARISSIVERSATEVWAGSERHGVWRFTINAAGEIADAKRIGEAEGLLTGLIAEAIVSAVPKGAATGLVASTRKGMFVLEGDRFVATPLDGLTKLLESSETVVIFTAPNGELRAYSPTRVFSQKKGAAWMANDVRALRQGAFQRHLVTADGSVVFQASASLLVSQAQATSDTAPPKVLLRQALQVSADGKHRALPIDSRTPLQLAEGQFSLQFDFALPQLSREGSKRYQSRLIGSDEKFSEWSSSHGFTYASLAPKDYRLEVRAMDANGRVSEMQPFEFSIAAPWYMSIGAKLGMVLLIIVGVWIYVVIFTRYRTKKLEGQNVVLETKVVERTRELADAIRRLDMMAHVDGLTGIPNRRRLDEYLPAVWALCRDQQKPLSVLVIDVDHFKKYNDENGHLAGDQVLKQLAEQLMQCLRRTEDLLARYGGEEFLVVLPGADADIAASMAETMRLNIESSSLGVTISVGVCTKVPSAENTSGSAAELIAAADKALYVAKREGRNVVRMCERS
jgi:diguanylate cyclase (GGDEF)-like protein